MLVANRQVDLRDREVYANNIRHPNTQTAGTQQKPTNREKNRNSRHRWPLIQSGPNKGEDRCELNCNYPDEQVGRTIEDQIEEEEKRGLGIYTSLRGH